eukprot:COSAG02_NODE_1943_length_10309_cov_29.284721_4_plen_400_part_00
MGAHVRCLQTVLYRMGAAASAERGRGDERGSGGRDDGFSRDGNYWEDEDEEAGDDHGLLELTAAETNPVAAKLQEIKARNSNTDKAWRMVDLRSRWHVEDSDVSKRMAELRVQHERRLVEWETEQHRKCAHCGKVIANEISKYVGHDMYVHTACHEGYTVSIAPECAHCHEKVVKVEGKFSGNKVKAQDGSVVHTECQELYLLAMGEPCAQCNERLAGEYVFSVDGAKVHEKCKDVYNRDQGLVCIQCHEAFEGAGADATDEQKRSMQRVNFGEFGWCHPGTCAVGWVREKAERCVHCGKPIMPRIGGSVKGDAAGDEQEDAAHNFLELEEDKGKVHLECHDAYRESHRIQCGVCDQPLVNGAVYSVAAQAPPVCIHADCRDQWLEQHGSAEFHLLRAA